MKTQGLETPEDEAPDLEEYDEDADEGAEAQVPFRDTAPARRLRGVGIVLIMLSALLLAFLGYLFGLSSLQEHNDQVRMYADLRLSLAEGTAPVQPAADGTPLAILQIPRLGVRQVVVEGSTASDLMHGPGHRRDTPLPGQPGVSVFYGRSATYGAPFGGIGGLRGGDTLKVTTGQGVFSFQVTEVGSRTVKVIPGASYLVLDTTHDYLFAPNGDLFAVAKLVGKQVPGNSGLPSISRAEVGGEAETSAFVALLLWSQFLLVAAVGATWMYVRWSRWPAYVVSTPILLAGFWNLFENVARLLPNTF